MEFNPGCSIATERTDQRAMSDEPGIYAPDDWHQHGLEKARKWLIERKHGLNDAHIAFIVFCAANPKHRESKIYESALEADRRTAKGLYNYLRDIHRKRQRKGEVMLHSEQSSEYVLANLLQLERAGIAECRRANDGVDEQIKAKIYKLCGYPGQAGTRGRLWALYYLRKGVLTLDQIAERSGLSKQLISHYLKEHELAGEKLRLPHYYVETRKRGI